MPLFTPITTTRRKTMKMSSRLPLLFLFSLLLYILLQQHSVNAQIIPSLVVHTRRKNAIHAKDLLYIDSRDSIIPPTVSTLYYLFQYGDAQRDPKPTLKYLNATEPIIFTTIFNEPGSKTINMTISDQPIQNITGIQNHIFPLAITSNGTRAPTISITIDVKEPSCYQYDLQIDWNTPLNSSDIELRDKWFNEQADVTARIRVLDSTKPVNLDATISATRAFASLNDFPTLVLHNMTHTYTFEVNNTLDSNSMWTLTIPAQLFNSTYTFAGSLTSQNVKPFECTIPSEPVDFEIPFLNSLTFGYDMNNETTLLASSQHRPLYLRHVSDTCYPNQAIILLGTDAEYGSRDYLGSMILVSSDGFRDQARLRDLSRSPSGIRSDDDSTLSLCGSLSDSVCRELMILDAAFLDDESILFATTAGLFVSSSFMSNHASSTLPKDVEFIKVATQTLFDSFPVGESTRAFSHCSCSHGTDSGSVFVIYPDPGTNSMPTNLIHTTTERIQSNQSWLGPLRVDSLPGVSNNYVFVSVGYCAMDKSSVYLVGIPVDANCTHSSGCPVRSTMLIAHNVDANSFMTRFTFPANQIITGMGFHANNIDVVVFGQRVWHSMDGGHSFRVIGNEFLNPREYFTEMTASPSSMISSITYRTNYNRLFYGTTDSTEIVLLPILQIPNTNTTLLTTRFDSSGRLSALTYRDYELTSRTIPVESVLAHSKYSTPKGLVPVFLGNTKVVFYAYENGTTMTAINGNSLGWEYDIGVGGMQIAQSNLDSDLAGSALITRGEVSDQLGVETVLERVFFVSDTISMSPAIANDLSIAILDDDTNEVELTLVNLVNDPVASGWFWCDVGKSVIVNHGYGSILLTELRNSTTMGGYIVRSPLDSLKFPNTTATVVFAGEWKMYDFREWQNLVKSNNQTLTISEINDGSAMDGLTRIVVADGTFKFDDSMRGVFVEIVVGGDKVYVIVEVVISETEVAGSVLGDGGNILTAGVYANGEWSVFWTNEEYEMESLRSETFVSPTSTYRSRPWSLSLDECLFNRISTNISSHITYLDMNETLIISASLENDPTRSALLASFSRLQVTLSDPSLLAYEISSTDNSDIYTDSLTIQLQSKGIKGQTLVSLRPTKSSLLCEKTSTTLAIVSGCDPTRYIRWDVNGVDRHEFLYGDKKLLGSQDLVVTLPFNYRPPSRVGYAVPISENIYHAAPEQPRYNDRYSISKITGAYKQCVSKPNRLSCGCSDEQRFSMRASDSDCIDKVLAVFYEDEFSPKFLSYGYGREAAVLGKRYRLVEVNNRTDYCLSATSDCTPQGLLDAVMDPMNNDTITWLGSELYHFRIEVVDEGFCQLGAEFMVYVVSPPPKPSTSLTTMSITSVTFCLGLLGVYFFHSWSQNGW